MNQISFFRKPFVRIQNPVGFAIREVFAVFAEKRTSAWAFTRQIFFTFDSRFVIVDLLVDPRDTVGYLLFRLREMKESVACAATSGLDAAT